MGYRINSKPKPKPQRSAVDIATPVDLVTVNGTTSEFAFPCWYQEVHRPMPAHCHDYHRHDYHGWPSPSHPGHACQLWSPDEHCCSIGLHHECGPHCKRYIDYAKVFPIHLLSDYEGYTSADVLWATEDGETPEGITISAAIDPEEDWVVRVYVKVDDPTALEKPARYRLTVRAIAPERQRTNPRTGEPGLTQPEKIDIVALARLTVLPAAYEVDELNPI